MHRGSELGTDGGVRAAYTAHGAELYRFALRGLGDVGLAEDAVQETFLRAWLAASRYDPARSSLRVWLFAIARNTLVDIHRRRGRLSFVPVVGADLAAAREEAAVDEAEAVLDRAVVALVLARLSDDHPGGDRADLPQEPLLRGAGGRARRPGRHVAHPDVLPAAGGDTAMGVTSGRC